MTHLANNSHTYKYTEVKNADVLSPDVKKIHKTIYIRVLKLFRYFMELRILLLLVKYFITRFYITHLQILKTRSTAYLQMVLIKIKRSNS